MKDILVVHLVRAANGIEPFKLFIESYNRHAAGKEHQLLLVFKGFPETIPQEFTALMPPDSAGALIDDRGYDITAYYAIFQSCQNDYKYFCFLNSYSIILGPDWLRKLHENISKSDTGLVGATGSWETPPGTTFPNYHIRTNAFMAESALLKAAETPIISKPDASFFEAGPASLTKTALSMGKNPLVVGKDGKGYTKEEWNISRTFRNGEQENLLVSDNRTSHYQHGTPEVLAQLAWGRS